jgi:hypothetical protein
VIKKNTGITEAVYRKCKQTGIYKEAVFKECIQGGRLLESDKQENSYRSYI